MEHSQWQSLLKSGNSCFHQQLWQQAEFFYQEAYDLLAHAYQGKPSCIDTMMAWICTCHNLSALYEKQDEIELALRFLMLPHEYLKQLCSTEQEDEDIKFVAIKGLNITASPIFLFIKEHEICQECQSRCANLTSLTEVQTQTCH